MTCLGSGLALPADQELLRQGRALVDLAAAGRPAGRGRGPTGRRTTGPSPRPGQVVAGLLVADVVGLAEAERRRQHGDRGLDVDPDVAGVHRRGCRARRAAGPGCRCRRSAGPRRSRTGPARRCPRCRRRGSGARTLPCRARRSRSRTRRRPRARGVPPAPSSAMSRIVPYPRAIASSESPYGRRPWTRRADHRRRARGVHRAAGWPSPTCSPDPIAMFRRWYDEAHAAGLHEPNAMVVATASARRAPSARLVLLKGVSDDGFVFYTNTGSRKGGELAANPRCALLFPWHPLERQVRVDGARRAAAAGGRGRVLRGPAARLPARRLGVPPVATRGRPRPSSSGVRRGGAAVRRRGRAEPGGVGRLPGPARVGGVLAGPARPDARPAGLPPRRPTAGGRSGSRPEGGATDSPHGSCPAAGPPLGFAGRDQKPVPGEPAPARRRAALGVGVLVLKLRRRATDVHLFELSPLLAGAIGAEIFILGFLLSGTAGDFKEAERQPGEVAASLETIADECLITYEESSCPRRTPRSAAHRDQPVGPAVADPGPRPGRRDVRHPRAQRAVPGVRTGDPGRLHHPAQDRAVRIRKLVMRMDTMRRTSYVAAGYLIAEVTAVLLFVLLVTDRLRRLGSQPDPARLVAHRLPADLRGGPDPGPRQPVRVHATANPAPPT